MRWFSFIGSTIIVVAYELPCRKMDKKKQIRRQRTEKVGIEACAIGAEPNANSQ